MPFQITHFTFGSAIQQICRLVGHPIPVDAAGSADPAVQQMGAAINVALGEMLTLHEWQDLTELLSLDIVGDAAGQKEKEFTLPDDFYRFIDQSQWGSNQFPANGPISAQAWMQYSVRNWNPQMTLFWQMRGDRLRVMAPPYPNPAKFEAFYITRAQVIDGDDPTLLKNMAQKNGDHFKLDSFMIMLLGRCRYLEWKGFDAQAALRDFLAVFNSRAGADKGAPVLSLARPAGFPLLSMCNVPVSGYGIS